MAGEMGSIDQEGRDSSGNLWSYHATVAKLTKGTLKPFDQYQGPYIITPKHGKLWISENELWSETAAISVPIQSWNDDGMAEAVLNLTYELSWVHTLKAFEAIAEFLHVPPQDVKDGAEPKSKGRVRVYKVLDKEYCVVEKSKTHLKPPGVWKPVAPKGLKGTIYERVI